jgi:hypothetical protein
LPVGLFNDKAANVYAVIRKLFDPKNPKLLQYFKVKDPYYFKWSVERVSEWKFEENPNVIQILEIKILYFQSVIPNPIMYERRNSSFPATKPKEVSKILKDIFVENI